MNKTKDLMGLLEKITLKKFWFMFLLSKVKHDYSDKSGLLKIKANAVTHY